MTSVWAGPAPALACGHRVLTGDGDHLHLRRVGPSALCTVTKHLMGTDSSPRAHRVSPFLRGSGGWTPGVQGEGPAAGPREGAGLSLLRPHSSVLFQVGAPVPGGGSPSQVGALASSSALGGAPASAAPDPPVARPHPQLSRVQTASSPAVLSCLQLNESTSSPRALYLWTVPSVTFGKAGCRPKP